MKKIDFFLWFIEIILESNAMAMLMFVEIVCTSLGFTDLSEKIETVIQKIWINELRICKINGISGELLEQIAMSLCGDEDLASFVRSDFEKYT